MAARASFDKRLHKINKRHRRLAEGWKPRMDRSGLISIVPARDFRLPHRMFFFVLFGFFVFKGFLLAQIGAAAYDGRLDRLEGGTLVERAGAWIMQVDPLTFEIARFLQTLFA